MCSDFPHFHELTLSAKDFCLHIERLESVHNVNWLADITPVLARLHVAIVQIDSGNIDYKFFTLPDLSIRFELFCKLKDMLKERDSYPLEFDSKLESKEMTGSLADDFTDIYFELKRGLSLLDEDEIKNREEASKLWQSGFILHWGQHLVDAQRQLYYLRVHNRL